MITNNKRAAVFHLLLLVGGMVFVVYFSETFLSWTKGFGYVLFFVLINAMYVLFGYLYGRDNGNAFGNLWSYRLIALIGIVIWLICLFLYIFSDHSSSFLGPEIIWLVHMAYNFPSFYMFKFINVDRLGGFFPAVLFVLNVYQSVLLWLGLQTRIFVMRAKSGR